MRWKAMIVAVACTMAGIIGCKQQVFLHEADYDHYVKDFDMPGKVESDPTASDRPIMGTTVAPPTVANPDRDIRYISLSECIAMALEHGTVGVQSPFFPGAITDTLVSFTGAGVAGSDSIRVLSLDPAITAANIEASLSKFDARWTSSMTWNTSDRPIGTALDTFQAAQANAGTQALNTTDATFSTALLKPLASGGVAGITFSTAYEVSNLNPRVNPSYRPTLQFQFEQPLLQGFGVEINQLRTSHPGSQLTPFSNTSRVEGILITRLRFDEQRSEFERNVNYLLLNVEIAYWNLYDAYWTLYSREQALRQAYEAWKINKSRYEAGRIAIQDYAQTRQQYELFRGQRITALGQVLENERQLRGFLGMPIEDGSRLVPVDQPNLTPYQPDWNTAVQEAMALRPEVILARHELKFRQLDVINVKNLLLPDLRFLSTYDFNGLGTRLDGPNGNNAFRSLASGGFNNWEIGLRMDVTLGFRDAHAQLRQARLNLARAYAVVQDQEIKAQRYLEYYYRRLFEFYEQIRAQRAQREAAAIQLDARFKEFLAGRGTLDILLEAQRVWADALRAEYDAIVQYNNAMAGFQFAKGTIQNYDNVVISEGPLPCCAQVRAVEHERQRTRALVLRERADTFVQASCACDGGVLHGAPQIPYGSAPSAVVTIPTAPVPDVPLPADTLKPLPPKEQPGMKPVGSGPAAATTVSHTAPAAPGAVSGIGSTATPAVPAGLGAEASPVPMTTTAPAVVTAPEAPAFAPVPPVVVNTPPSLSTAPVPAANPLAGSAPTVTLPALPVEPALPALPK